MRPIVKLFGSTVVVACALSAYAAEPWISVPSTPTSDGRMVVTGGELGASAPLMLRIEHPAGLISVHPVVADAAGKLRFEYTLALPGAYGVEVVDAAGKLIGSGRLGHIQ